MTTEELATMSDEAKRIRIAEILGAKWATKPNFQHDGKWHWHFAFRPFEFDCEWESKQTKPPREQCVLHYDIPDYLNDLNAMHEAEKMLSDDQCEKYQNAIDSIMGELVEQEQYPVQCYWLHATARQRADAFLLTLA